MNTSKTLANVADAAFQTISKATARKTRKASKDSKAPTGLNDAIRARMELFVKAINANANADRLTIYKARDGRETFDHETARAAFAAITRTLKAIKAEGIAVKMVPLGRQEPDGTVLYGIAGYTTRKRTAPSFEAL